MMALRRSLIALLALALLIAAGLPARAIESEADLPLPRFVSLKSAEVNVRSGPGQRYPIEWVYRRAGLPVEVIAEFDQWRRIRDQDGVVGWVHQALLSGRRTAVILGETRVIRADPSPEAAPVFRAQAGVVVSLKRCTGAWCRVEVRALEGWLPRVSLWGINPEEELR